MCGERKLQVPVVLLNYIFLNYWMILKLTLKTKCRFVDNFEVILVGKPVFFSLIEVMLQTNVLIRCKNLMTQSLF